MDGNTDWNTGEQLFRNLAERSRHTDGLPWPARVLVRGWQERHWRWHRLWHPMPWTRAWYCWQRSWRGWADCDVWDVDAYITRIASQMLSRLAETTHGWPGSTSAWPTYEEWQAYLRDLSGRLAAWNDDTFCDERAYRITQAAMEEFGKNLGDFWD